jgi:hypothetical protein
VARFLKSKLWRAIFRLAGVRLPGLLRKFRLSKFASSDLLVDTMFEEELSMRLLIRAVAPWISSLDRTPVLLEAPTMLLRVQRTADDDVTWRRRCGKIAVYELPGEHDTLFEPESVGALHEAFVTATPDWRNSR